MCVNHFKRLTGGKYKDTITGVMLVREREKDWVICIDDHRHCAFVTLQWGEPLATFRISGFCSMKEAKEYEFFHLFQRTGRPHKNKKGETVSVPVTGLGSVPVVARFLIDDLAVRQGMLFDEEG